MLALAAGTAGLADEANREARRSDDKVSQSAMMVAVVTPLTVREAPSLLDEELAMVVDHTAEAQTQRWELAVALLPLEMQRSDSGQATPSGKEVHQTPALLALKHACASVAGQCWTAHVVQVVTSATLSVLLVERSSRQYLQPALPAAVPAVLRCPQSHLQ